MNAPSFRETRSKAEIDELLRHDFIVPINRGFTAKYVAEHYPGWTWNQLIRVLNAAGVRVPQPGRPSKCHDDVVRVRFDSDRSWQVEWADGATTEGPEPAGTTQPAPTSGTLTAIHDLRTGMMVEVPDTPDQLAGAPALEHSGWPADGHPIFIEADLGHVLPSEPIIDGLGKPRSLTTGASVPSDASAEAFAQAWTTLLSERPEGAELWEYSVEEPRSEEVPQVSGPLPVDVALERVRMTPGARLRRRAVGRWQLMPTPFPSLVKDGWAELEAEKKEWSAALTEFPPSYRSTISRMGGIDATPQEWTEFARRAAAAGFTPLDYRLLGTAHLAWTAREGKERAGRMRSTPPLQAIEVWAIFPTLIASGLSPLEAVGRIIQTI